MAQSQLRFEGAGEGAPTLTVAQLNARVAGAVEAALPDEVWVRGELQSLSRRPSGHTYFDLVEQKKGSRWPSARLSVVLFAQERQWVEAQLVDVPDFRLAEGLEVRIRGRVSYYGPMGRLQLVMSAIDPIFTLGAMAAERDRTLRRLAAEGVLDRNKAVALPPVPLVVGLVTSVESAAYNDVVRELSESGLAFRVLAVDARMQGRDAPAMVIRALRSLAFRGVDAIALVRGGGSVTDLATFDDERIARCIAGLDVAVLTGIGHEIDTTVADHAAHLRCTTPTACARTLVERVRAYRARTESAWAGIATAARAGVAAADRRLTRLGTGTRTATVSALRLERRRIDDATRRVGADHLAAVLDRQRSGVDRHAHRLGVEAARRVGGGVRHLDGLEARIRLLDPARTLARGYTITTTEAGEVVKDPARLAAGDGLVTRFATGTATSRVMTTDPGSTEHADTTGEDTREEDHRP